jgi:hypothetical protein
MRVFCSSVDALEIRIAQHVRDGGMVKSKKKNNITMLKVGYYASF